MIELYLAECRRFARWAAIATALHAAGLLMLDNLMPGITAVTDLNMLAAGGYCVAATVFGVYQGATYARMNHWIALLHRPLAPWRIMAGVVGAGATMVVIVLLLPFLTLFAVQALGVDAVVDTRHWLLALIGTLIGLIGFFAGSYAAVAPRRYGWTGLVVAAILMVGTLASGAAALLLPAILVAVLVLLTTGAFRPDRTRAPTNGALLALTGVVAATAIYFILLLGGGFAYHMTLAALGRNPLVNAPAPGGLVESSRSNGDALIAAALANAPGSAAAEVLTRLRGVEAKRLPVAREWLPMRGDLTNEGPIGFTDERRGIAWTYSHDANAYRGLRLRDRRPVGTMAPAGGFVAPPFALGDGWIASGGGLYRFDEGSGRVARALTLPSGEVIAGRPVPLGDRLAVLGNRALHLFDMRSSTPTGIAVPLPGQIGDLRRLDAIDLPDRLILSLFFGQNSIEGPTVAWQRVVSVTPDGRVTTLAQRSFAPEFSDVLRFRATWLSPLIHVVAEGAERIGAVESPSQRRAPIRLSDRVWAGTAILSILAAIGTALLARRRRLRTPAVAGWTVMALALGLPGFLAFCLVERKSPA